MCDFSPAMKKPVRILLLLIVLASTGFAEPANEMVAACREGKLETVEKLLRQGAKVAKVAEVDDTGRSPLLSAVFSRRVDLVRLLLKAGADPNQIARCPESRCPSHPSLVFASYLNEPEIVKMLLAAKADISWGDHRAIKYANVRCHMECFRLLKAAGGIEAASPPADEPGGTGKPPPPPATLGLSEIVPGAKPPVARAPAGERPRLALIMDDSLQDLSALLTAELSGQNWQLVERDELNRVLEEQSLSSGQAGDAGRAVNVGQLLHADAVALGRRQFFAGKPAVEFRVVRVSPGVVLEMSMEPFPGADPTAWVRSTAGLLNSSVQRLRAAKAVALALTPLRATSDSPKAISLARDTAALLRSRLLREPGLVLVERAALENLARERALGAAGDFWAGSYVVDGVTESPLSPGAPATLRVRFQPLDQSPPLNFTATGAENDRQALAEKIVLQALAALAVQPAPARAEVAREADRHFQQARSLYQSDLFHEALVEAKTARLLGLQTPAAKELHLRTGMSAITQQFWAMGRLNFETVLFSGWGEEWMQWRLGGRDYLRPPEILETAREMVELWRELLAAAWREGNHQNAAKLLLWGDLMQGAALGAWAGVDTAAGRLAYPAELAAIPRSLIEAFDELLPMSRTLALPSDRHRLVKLASHFRPILYPDTESLTASILKALDNAPAEEDPGSRAYIFERLIFTKPGAGISMIVEGTGTPVHIDRPGEHTPPVRGRVLSVLEKSTAPLDRLMVAFLRTLLAPNVAAQREASDRLFDDVWKARAAFLEWPEPVIRLFEAAQGLVSSMDAEAVPKWRYVRDPGAYTGHIAQAVSDLRRRLFFFVARESRDPQAALELYDSTYHPPNEDQEELQRAVALARTAPPRWGEPSAAPPAAPLPAPVPAPISSKPSAPAAPVPTPTPFPRIERPPVPSFAAAPPLPVKPAWRVSEKLPDRAFWFGIDFHSAVVDGDRVWFFGDNHFVGEESTDPCLVEITLPSFATREWPLPPELAKAGGGRAWLEVAGDRLVIAKGLTYFAIWDRRADSWKINRELRPVGRPLRRGEEVYLLTGAEGERAIVCYHLDTHEAELLASSRRVPAQTPLDTPALEPIDLLFMPEGKLGVVAADVDRREKDPNRFVINAPRARHSFLYDPQTREWNAPKTRPLWAPPPPPPEKLTYVHMPVTRPGFVFGGSRRPGFGFLQLPFPELPFAAFPFAVEIPQPTPQERGGDEQSILRAWLWTGHGYLAVDTPFQNARTLYFLPIAAVESYVKAHQPVPDQQLSGYPAPVAVKEAGK